MIIFTFIAGLICLVCYFFVIKQKKQTNIFLPKKEPHIDVKAEPNCIVQESIMPFFTQEAALKTESSQENLLLDQSLIQTKPIQSLSDKREAPLPKKTKPSENEILYLILSAKSGKPYVGYELLQALLSAGLRFGPMDLFHYYQEINGKDKILLALLQLMILEPLKLIIWGLFLARV